MPFPVASRTPADYAGRMGSLLGWGLAALALILRLVQVQADWGRQQALFPAPVRGDFRAWVAEAPEVLYPREPGGHADGRAGEDYAPEVAEVRAACVLLSLDGKPLAPVKARVTFTLSPRDPQPRLAYGGTVEFYGRVGPPSPALNPGQFDEARFLRDRGMAYVGSADAGAWRPIPGAPRRGFFLARWAAGLKEGLEARVDALWPYPESALMEGVLLGDRTGLPQDLVESFIVTGTVHILAVSGLITAFVAGALFLCFRALRAPRRAAAGLTLIGLVFFVLVTGAHPPVLRAGIFAGLALTALLAGRRVWPGTLLLATAFLVALLNPFALEDFSFQISFLATAGLMVMGPALLEKCSFLGKPLALVAASTLAAQLSVWALLLAAFHLLALYSVPANLVVVPLVLFSVAGGLAALAGAFVHPLLGKLLAAGVFPALHLLMALAGWMARWPLAQFPVASPPGAWLACFHAWLLWTFFAFWPRMRPEKPSADFLAKRAFFRRAKRAAVGGGVFFLGRSAALGALDHWAQGPSLRVTFLAVGHGNAAVVRAPGGGLLVVDGGKETRGPDRYLPLVSYLRALGARKVDAALDTHPDEDHVGGLVNLASAYPLGRAYEGEGATASTAVYRAFHAELAARGDPLVPLEEGCALPEAAPAQALVLHPPRDFHPPEHAD
ncbi:MAG TPA: ComEC/Rec2 family competence protein, partial [bacterium]|nr:ComEC/Rec2 family competence protein [bacterium]